MEIITGLLVGAAIGCAYLGFVVICYCIVQALLSSGIIRLPWEG